MILNGIEKKTDKIDAEFIIRKNSSSTHITITSKEGLSITLTFNDKNYDPRNIKINETIDLNKHIFWDVTLLDIKTYYLFDISKDKVLLTRLEDNLFRVEVDINDPDMIYTPSKDKNEFKSLQIEETFKFNYEDKK